MRYEHARWLMLSLCLVALAACTAPSDNAGAQYNQQITGGVGGAAGTVMQPASGGVAGATPVVTSGGIGGASGTGLEPTAGDVSGAAGMIMAGTGVMAGGVGGGVPMDLGDADVIDDPDAGMMMMSPTDEGEGDGKDVVTIGDSWMNIFTNGGGIEGGLDRAGKHYRHYAVAGTTLNGQIPGQYTNALRVGAIKTVIMTGGGNDIMYSNACATKEGCEAAVQMISEELNDLWSQMADDGVKDVVYIAYSKNAGTAPKDTRPAMSPIPSICLTTRIRCHSIDTTPLVAATDLIDGIHPTSAACDRIADEVLSVMGASGARR